jgi:PKD repeat protein
VELFPCDDNASAKNHFVLGETVWVKFSIRNYDDVEHSPWAMISVFDANAMPLGASYQFPHNLLLPGNSASGFYMAVMNIPVWAQPGNATLCASIFSDFPQNGGVPYCEEESVNFEIRRNPEIGYSTAPAGNPQGPSGTFASSFKLSSKSEPGEYLVYVSARSLHWLSPVQASTVFSLSDAKSPPTASFTYYPVYSYVNMNITFDASASTAEGYGVSIGEYEWDFGDGSPKVTLSTPVTSHIFTLANDYVVTLNVTDSQGKWSTNSKIVTILPRTGPQANFIVLSSKNKMVTFNATGTMLGWDGTLHPPIVDYIWDFGDGNVTSGNYAKIFHIYTAYGDYVVKLTVTDAHGDHDDVQGTVKVQASALIGDINGDGTVDILDAIAVSLAFNSVPGSSDWNSSADLNDDKVIDIYDAIILANQYTG